VEVELTSEQRATLRAWVAAGTSEQRLTFRAQIILAVAEGQSNAAVADRLATRLASHPAMVIKWRGCFARRGLVRLTDAPRNGKLRRYAAEAEQRIVEA
jgi:transposase